MEAFDYLDPAVFADHLDFYQALSQVFQSIGQNDPTKIIGY